MAFAKKTIRDVDVNAKRVLVRVDYNVPTDENGKVQDDLRIRAGLPTLKYLLKRGCKLVLMSHLGRPEGKPRSRLSNVPAKSGHQQRPKAVGFESSLQGKPDPRFSLADAAKHLEKLLARPVSFVPDCLDPTPPDAPITLLENLRFHPEEEANDRAFAKKLAKHGELFVNDAFGAVHRANASLSAITEFLPSVAGLLLEREVDEITEAVENPNHPLVIVLGGAKIADKIELIDNFLSKADAFLIAGAMANTFLAMQGKNIGKSKYDADDLDEAKRIWEHARTKGVKVLLPDRDVVVGQSPEDKQPVTKPLDEIAGTDMILDIGPASLGLFEDETSRAKTVIWNGTLGVTEFAPYAEGSRHFARSLAKSGAKSIIGGGDTAGFIDTIGMLKDFTHVSTGGGASLELMAGKKLPGVEALLDK